MSGMRPTDRDLERWARRSLVDGAPKRADLTALYLFCPVELDVPGGRMKVRSSLDALLQDTRAAAQRHQVTGKPLGKRQDSTSWLGAMGYLTLLEQLGTVLDWPDMRPRMKRWHRFETMLVDEGFCDQDEASALYALRNAMVHSYGLANSAKEVRDPIARSARAHLFALDPGSKLVDIGSSRWDGDWATAAQSSRTHVSVVQLGDLAENVVLAARTAYGTARPWKLAGSVTAAQGGATYFFWHGV